MPSSHHTDWVSPAKAITGRDHLAVQAVSEHLYAGLLPGLTNVTDRARCYGFYPWFVWAFDARYKKKGPEDLIKVFRRAECLHTLIGIVHELDQGDERLHGGGLVGRDALVAAADRIVSGDTVRLSRHSKLEPADGERYFKHKLGGLGQYYLGPLKDLEVLDGNAQEGLRYTAEWGRELAAVHDHRVDATGFFDAVDGDRVDLGTVRALSPFCPCHLRKNKSERDAIVRLLFRNGEGPLKQEIGDERRQTLTLVLDYARALRTSTQHFPDSVGFLDGCYANALPNGTAWAPPPGLTKVGTGWAIYKRHELLALAVQGLFWAGLTALLDEGGFVADGVAYGSWFAKRFRHALGHGGATATFPKLVQSRRRMLPPLEDSRAPEHEVQIAESLLAAQSESDADGVAEKSLQILLSLVARGIGESPYGDLVVADRFFQTYEINLFSLQHLARDEWASQTGTQWVEWLAAEWAIRVHFRVALRKLRYQSQDSFRIVPLDEGYRVREAPRAQWSSPRLPQAFRFLYDLGALDLHDELEGRPYVLSPFGEQLLEAELGRR
jgi:hypothetical protein